MPNDLEKEKPGVIGEVAGNLGTVFRHLLPGVLIVGAARITHPAWFCGFKSDSWQYITTIGVIAVAVGNAWFSLNRYVVHQLLDYIFWRCGLQGPAKSDQGGYLDHLAKYTREAVIESKAPKLARQHVSFRAASVLLIYTISELLFVSAFWSEDCAITSSLTARIVLGVSGLFLFVLGIWQNIITRRIDAAILHAGLVK
jgi:hypothetical protein